MVVYHPYYGQVELIRWVGNDCLIRVHGGISGSYTKWVEQHWLRMREWSK